MGGKLGALAAFQSFPEAAVEELSGLAEAQDLEPGAALFREGDPGDAIFVVEHGEIEIRKGERVLARLCAGQTVGEMAVLEEQRRSADAVTTGSARVYRFDRVAFVEFLVSHPECGAPFFLETGREMSRRLRNTSDYLMTVFEVGRIVASGYPVPELAARIVKQLLKDMGEATCGHVLLRHPLADDIEVVGRAGATDLDDDSLLALATKHTDEPGFHDLLEGRAVLGAILRDARREVAGALLLEKSGDETPFTIEQEIVLEAVALQTEQGILAAWTREEDAARERLERHRQQGY